jgi:CRP-like cAMP-binding protein
MPAVSLDQLSIFEGFSSDQLELLQPLFTICEQQDGDVLFQQGETAGYLYFLVQGEAVVRYKPDDGPWLTVARIHPEGVLGWPAALCSPLYTSSGICTTDSILLRISNANLRRLCEEHPLTGSLVLERLATMIAQRLRNTHSYVIALLEQGLGTRIQNP